MVNRRFEHLIPVRQLDCEAELEPRRERNPISGEPAWTGLPRHGGTIDVKGVLIVDDDPKVRRTLRAILEGSSHSVLEAGNGREALRLIDQHHPDLMIVDIVMPEMDGLETIRMLRGKGLRMPIIAMPLRADSTAQRYSEFAKSFGADDVLLKPFADTDVLDVVARVLAGGKSADGSGTSASA